MKLNNKGFMLAEVVVVSVVIATTLVTLYVALNRLISAFDTRNTYYDVDAAYLAIEANNILIDNGKINTLILNKNTEEVTSNLNDIIEFYSDNISGNISDNINVYFSLYPDDILDANIFIGIRQTFKDYIDYLNSNLNFEDPYTYVIISEICETDDNCRYYTLKVR